MADVDTRMQTATISVLVENEAGVLARVIGLFSGRGYNIDSLTVAPVDDDRGRSRINVVTSGTEMVIEQIKAQLDRLVPVYKVADLTREGPHIARELALIKVIASGENRSESLRIGEAFRARVVDATVEQLRVRDDRQHRQDRRLHCPDAAAGPGRSLPQRHRRHQPRPPHALSGGCRGRTLSNLLNRRISKCAFTTTAMPT